MSIPIPTGLPVDRAFRARTWLALLIFPALLLFLSTLQVQASGAYFERGGYDPEYQYLLNGLKILELRSPDHVDHPGTTLQVLSGLASKARHVLAGPVQAGNSLRLDVLANPEPYVQSLRLELALTAAALSFLVAAQIYCRTRLFWASIAFQLLAFGSPSLMQALVHASPEPLLIIVVLFLSALLIRTVTTATEANSHWLPILLGLILGFGLVTKLTFSPFLLLLLWFPRWRDRALSTLACIGGTLLLTVPIWSKASQVAHWVEDLLTRQGAYGSGPEGFLPGLPVLFSNLRGLAVAEPVYFGTLAFMIGGVLIIGRPLYRTHRSVILRYGLLLGVLLLQLMAAMKQGTPRYLVPGLAFLGTTLVFGVLAWRQAAIAPPGSSRVWKSVAFGVAIVVAAFGAVSDFGAIRSAAQQQAGTVALNALLAKEYPECTVIPHYGASGQTFGLHFANEYSNGYFAADLARLYPRTLVYHDWGRQFFNFRRAIDEGIIRARLDDGECLLLRGRNRIGDISSSLFAPELVLEEIATGPSEVVYSLKQVLP